MSAEIEGVGQRDVVNVDLRFVYSDKRRATICRTMVSALLTALSLTILSLASADVNYMRSCASPAQCRCNGPGATEVSCRNAEFTEIPKDVPVNITKL